MRIAIIALPDNPASQQEQDPLLWERDQLFEEEQALAIAHYFNEHTEFAPAFICKAESSLEKKALKSGLTVIPTGGMLNSLRLWQWQRKQSALHILVIGGGGLKLGRKLCSSRKADALQFNAAFFLAPPSLEGHQFLSTLDHCFCGSDFVVKGIKKILSDVPDDKKIKLTRFPVIAPGMNLEGFDYPPPEFDSGNGAHFVFGMAESLLPDSGALLVTRAMAALWQKEELPPWEVRMFGAGPRFSEILAEAENLGVSSRLAILGEQPLYDVCQHCDAWLAPGSSPTELPSTLWAAYAAGLPLVCSSSPLHRERILDPHSALKVDAVNPQELARAMIAIMRDKNLRARMTAVNVACKAQTSYHEMAEKIARKLQAWAPLLSTGNPSAPGKQEIKKM